VSLDIRIMQEVDDMEIRMNPLGAEFSLEKPNTPPGAIGCQRVALLGRGAVARLS
jgi:hypothetical protein